MNVLSLFSGIGGLDLGLERAGMTVVGQVEIDPWCRTILAKHWPEVPRHDDVRTAARWWLQSDVADAECSRLERGTGSGLEWSGESAEGSPGSRSAADSIGRGRPAVDLVCGGFPCQPVSLAGKGLAQADSRWLWPAFADVVRHLRPAYVLVENVPGLLGRGMGDVLGDLASLGYDTEWDCVPAAFVGAPHIRNRVWIVAYPQREPLRGQRAGSLDGTPRTGESEGPERERVRADARHGSPALADAPELLSDGRDRQPGREVPEPRDRRSPLTADPYREPLVWPAIPRRERFAWPAEPDVCRVAHGIPRRVDRLRGLGNAVVPQVAEHVGRLIMAVAA